MDHPTITMAVVVPVYNGEDFVDRCLASILEQTRPPEEIIVVDDGSTDRTSERLTPFQDRVRIVRTPNRGLAAARNTGFLSARSRYVVFLDADDGWPRHKLEIYEAHARQDPSAGLFYSDFFCVASGRVYRRVRTGAPGPDPFFRLLRENFVASSTVMVKKDLWELVGGLRGGFAHPAGVVDWDFFLKASLQGRFHHIPEPLMFYRVHEKSAMQNRLEALWKDGVRVILSHRRRTPRRVLNLALASIFYQSGVRFMTAGFLQRARAHFARSIRYSYGFLPSAGLFLLSLTGSRAVSILLALRRRILHRVSGATRWTDQAPG